MKYSIKKFINMFLVIALTIATTSCSMLNDLRDSLIELDVSYGNTSNEGKKNNVVAAFTEETISLSNGDVIYKPLLDNAHYDEDSSTIFFDNLILVYTFSDVDVKTAKSLASLVDGEIVGDISGSVNVLQIKIKQSSLYEIEVLSDKLMESDYVMYASYDYPVQIMLQETDLNPWSSDPSMIIADKGQENNPGGNDWWAEAIGAYSAWEYSDMCQPITVGIIDDGFETTHDDLKGKMTFLEGYSQNTSNSHGTHVAGLIAASNNKVGIRGVSDNADLICADFTPLDTPSDSDEINYLVSGEYIEITKLMVDSGARVINNSWGKYFFSKDGVTREALDEWEYEFYSLYRLFSDKYSDNINELYNSYVKYMNSISKRTALECTLLITQLIINKHDDFLIVASAGNGYDNGGFGVDTKYSCFYSAIDGSIFELLSANTRNKLDGMGITYSSINEHKIIVGAVENSTESGNYKMTYFSNYGANVDICAPGKDIASTITENKYGFLSGTSMAAPIVSGAAAFLWSINPRLTAKEVKTALIENTTCRAIGVGTGSSFSYPMLNIGAAAKKVSEDVAEKTKKYAFDFYGMTMQDIVDIYGEEKARPYILTQGNVGLYVPNIDYVFIPEVDTDIIDDSYYSYRIAAIEILKGGSVFKGAVIDGVLSDILEKVGEDFLNNIIVSDVNGNFVYIENNEKSVTYIDLSESPNSSNDKPINHINTMKLTSGLVKFTYNNFTMEETTSAETEATTTGTTIHENAVWDERLIENVRQQIIVHYTDLWQPTGSYDSFNSDDMDWNGEYIFVLRYSRSQDELKSIDEYGGLMPSANVWFTTVYVDKMTGKVRDDMNSDIWYVNLNSSSSIVNILVTPITKPQFNVKEEIDSFWDYIHIAAREDASFSGENWNLINMYAYITSSYSSTAYLDKNAVKKVCHNFFDGNGSIPELNYFSIDEDSNGYSFHFGDPQELDVKYISYNENADGTVSVFCDVYAYFQSNTKNESEYGMIKKCEVILTPNKEYDGAEFTNRYNIKSVNRIASYNYAGSCGENVMYAIDEDNVAYIYGNGKMSDYSYTTVSQVRTNSPFSDYDLGISISKVIIEEGVTYIGKGAFPTDCDADEFYIPKSVTAISDEAFADGSIRNNKKVKITIYCYDDSYALEYAKTNGINYVIVD